MGTISRTTLLLLLSVLQAVRPDCTFTQDCVKIGSDSACLPRAFAPDESSSAFPLDADHGFLVEHTSFWDGTTVDPSTGQCKSGAPDTEGKCMQGWNPKWEPFAPVMCPQYAEAGCCTWEQNWTLYQNLILLVDSFGGSTGCLACAYNLVAFWCGLICSGNQSDYLTLHDPPMAKRDDDMTGAKDVTVLQADITVDASYVCQIYDSCKGTALVGEATAMQSAVGLLSYQLQTGAIGHGEYFFLNFTRDNTNMHKQNTNINMNMNTKRDSMCSGASTSRSLEPIKSFSDKSFSAAVLPCDSYMYPGTDHPPFPYPPPEENMTTCGCSYCKSACGGEASPITLTSIPYLNGFNYKLVSCVYVVVALLVGWHIFVRRSDAFT